MCRCALIATVLLFHCYSVGLLMCWTCLVAAWVGATTEGIVSGRLGSHAA